MRRTAILLLMVAALFGCVHKDRPEGSVERWLVAIGQGTAGEPERYASEELTASIAPLRREPGILEVVEVGRGKTEGDSARVPFRVQKATGETITGIAELRREPGESWRIVRLAPNDSSLRVPSRGGERIGKASSLVWLGAVLSALSLMLLVAGLMRLTPEAMSDEATRTP